MNTSCVCYNRRVLPNKSPYVLFVKLHHIPIWGWLTLGLAIRLLIAPLGAHPGDFATFVRWAEAIQSNGFMQVYQITDANYPPLALAILGVSHWIGSLVLQGDATSPLWFILLKLPPILADLGIAWVVHTIRAPASKSSNLAFLLVLFNPALIYLSAWWGQYESLYALGALAALIDATQGWFFRAGVWIALGALIKLQALAVVPILIPVIIAAESRSPLYARLLTVALGASLPLIVSFAPFAVTGQLDIVFPRLIALVASPSWLTINALNLWYLVTLSAGNWRFNAPLSMPDSSPVLLGISARAIGLAMLSLWILLVLALWLIPDRAGAQGRRRNITLWLGDPAYLSAALIYLGIFLFPTQSHERYSFAAVVMLAAALAYSPRALIWFIMISSLHFINLIWAAPFHPSLVSTFSGNNVIGVAISTSFLLIACGALIQLSVPYMQSFPSPLTGEGTEG